VKFKIKNFFSKDQQRGFSLLELMMVAGMIGGMALTITKIGEMGNRSIKTNEYMFEKNSLVQEIERYLLNKDACEETFRNARLSGTPNEVTMIKSQKGDALFLVDEIYGNRMVRFKSFTLKPDDPPPHANKTLMASVIIEIEKIPSQAYGSQTEERKFSIQVKTDANERVETCYSATDNAVETARKLTCADFGGTFNEVDNRCESLGRPVKMAVCEMTDREFDESTQNCRPKLVELDTTFCQVLAWTPTRELRCPDGHIMLGLRSGNVVGTWGQIHCCPMMIQ
jgi:hypothetical protein